MKIYKVIRAALFLAAMHLLASSAWAQPEFYADPFLGYPEFRVLPLRLPTANPDSVEIGVHVRILYDDLQFVKVANHYEAGYGLDVVLLDGEEQTVGSNHIERQVSVDNYGQTNSRQLNDQTICSFTIALHPVQLRVSLVDRESRKERTLTKKIEFPEKEWGRNLRLGDLVLLDAAGSVQMGSGFLRDQPLRAACWLYSDAESVSEMAYRLVNENDQIVFNGKMALQPAAHLRADTLDLPIKDLPSGSYRLILEASAETAKQGRAYPFKIIWQNLPDYIQDLDLAIRELKYIATDEEMDRLVSAPPSRREEIFQEFWKKQDPTPSTPGNEKMEEYYRRVRYANEQFSGLRDGWETDMGRIYIIFGPPTDVERHPFDIDKKPYEYWYYYDLNRKFLFVDEDGFGEYRLKTPIWHDY